MQRLTARLDALEGRLIAHRRVLAQLVAILPPASQAAMRDWLEQREIMSDGQEDPGALDPEAAALELALADEMRLIEAVIAALAGAKTA